MTTPAIRNLAHYRGDTLGVLLRLWHDDAATDPVDLAGATVTAQVRLTADTATAIADFDVETSTNEISLTLPPGDTATLPAKAVWDCQVDWLSDGTSIQTVVAGQLTTTPDVTRP